MRWSRKRAAQRQHDPTAGHPRIAPGMAVPTYRPGFTAPQCGPQGHVARPLSVL